MSVQFTEQQRRAIQARGKNMIVSAGAGSGKTTVMIERIYSLLCEGADLDRMAVCTFTNASAADMRAKLAARLSGGTDRRAGEQLAKLATAQIGTIHSFCMHLVRNWFFACGLDPSFGVLEESEALSLRSECAEAAIADEKAKGNENFIRLYTVFASAREHRQLKSMILKAADYALAQPDPHAWLCTSPRHTDAEYRARLNENLNGKFAALDAEVRALATQDAAAGYAKDHDALQAMSACLRGNLPYDGGVPVLSAKEKEKNPAFEPLHDAFKALLARYKKLREQQEKIQEMPSHEGSDALAATLGALVSATLRIYDEAKRARRKVDYSDLEHYALKVLCDDRYGAEAVKAYDYVFVDEYQDVSPLQERILNTFHGGMFFVGDIKQSIYGFRMCDPRFFWEKRAAYKTGKGEAVGLTANFRSGERVLDFVNRVFSRLMTADFGGTDYNSADERMESRTATDASVSAVLIDKSEKKEEGRAPRVYSVLSDRGAPVNAEAEAEVREVVKEIERLKAGRVPLGDGKERAAQYADIAVLVRSRGRFTDRLTEALREKSIPACFVSSEQSADEFYSVNDLLCFLRLLDNACDDVSLAAVMLSHAYGGFCEEELAEIRKSGDGAFCELLPAYAKAGANEALRKKAADFTDALARFRALSQVQDVAALAGAITSQYDAFSEAIACGGEREAAALDAFIEHLAAQSEHNTLHEYMVYLRRTGLPRLSVSAVGDAVRIMTIHASKGLEFPYVLLPDLEKKFNLSDTYAQMICDRDEGIVLRSYDFAARSVCENPRFACLASSLRHALTSEALRVLYVAMTRAQVRLAMFAVSPGRSERKEDDSLSFFDFLQDDLLPIATHVSPDDAPSFAPPVREEQAPDLALGAALASGFAARAQTPHGRVKASVSSIAHRPDPDEDDAALSSPPLFGSDDRAAERGSAYHLFMEHVRFGQSGEWQRLCARYPQEGELIDRAQIERAFTNTAAFIGGRPYHREQPFVYRVAASALGEEGDFVLVQGIIDLLIEDGDGAVIVDYKTGAPTEENTRAYAKQLALYAEAVENILHKKVRGTYLYWFKSGSFAKIGE